MRNRMSLIWLLSLLILFYMFNVADATEVYVIGSPSDLPEYNKNLTVNIKVYDAPEKGIILVRLSTKSSMVGYCTNYPVNDTGNTNDIQLHASINSGWTDAGTGVLRYDFSGYYKEDYNIPLLVTTYDSGAWGILSADVYEDKDRSSLWKAKNTGTVPRDENNNHIADDWKGDFTPYKWINKEKGIVNVEETRKQKGIKDYPYSKPAMTERQNTVDAETGPKKNKENGDGFTVFEEYRGFMLMSVTSKADRFDPATKEVGIVLHSTMTAYGTGNVNKHPSHSFREFGKDYVSKPFVEVWNNTHTGKTEDDVFVSYGQINTNSDGIPDTEYVYAVRVRNSGEDPSMGREWLGSAILYKPTAYSIVNIYVTDITAWQKDRLPNYTVNQIVNHVTGHEVGHAINVGHCPQSCVDNTKTCMMRHDITRTDKKGKIIENNIDASPSSYHYIDYDLAGDRKTPQPEAEPEAEPEKKPDDKKKPKGIKCSLSSSSGSYTAEAGDSHTSNFSTSSPYSSVYWYVKTPSDTDTTVSTQEIDQGDGSLTTADFTYTFPSGVSGDYVFKAYVYDGDMTTIYEESYTVSVSLPTPPTVPLPVWSDIPDPYNLTVGDSFYLDLSSYVTGSPSLTKTGGSLPAGLSFSNGVVSGTVSTVEVRNFRFTATNSTGSSESEWVNITVAAAPVPLPVWSDIPDPYNLIVGNYFSLDLSSYVTGSPSLTKTGGSLPAGLSFSNGVVSGTVSTIEVRNFRFTATNSIGSSESEWIQINVTAP